MRKQIRVTLPSAVVAPERPPEARRVYSNSEVFPLTDFTTVTSPITITGRQGYASAETWIAVSITHTFVGDLSIILTGPSGAEYVILSYSADVGLRNILDLSAEPASGTWTLAVTDGVSGDSGQLNSWAISF
jgi:subtilisin-like proprotein convertase family protein